MIETDELRGINMDPDLNAPDNKNVECYKSNDKLELCDYEELYNILNKGYTNSNGIQVWYAHTHLGWANAERLKDRVMYKIKELRNKI